MLTAIFLTTALLAAWAMAALRAPLVAWTGLFGLGLAAWTLGVPWGPGPLAAWVAFLGISLALNLPGLRRRLLTDRILELLRKKMPAISETEREALQAGTVWWDGELFTGRPDWKKLLDLPPPRLTAEEQAFLDGPVEALCRMLDDWRINEEWHDLPPEVWKFIKENGFFGMIIPKKYEGLEFSALAHSAVVQKVASRSIAGAVTVMVPNSLGPAELLLRYGTEEQKNYYLPRLARGEEVPCFALTGPEAGSDAASMPDRGVVCYGEFRGQRVLGIRLNWEKRYITLGPVATVLGLAFRLYDPDRLLGRDRDEIGITLALIPTATQGVSIGRRHHPLGIAFQNGPTTGRDVFIPLDWVIGGAERAGQGWGMLMESLAAGRSISLPALSAGSSKLAGRVVGAYARLRQQFNMPIGYFEGVEEALARIAGYTYLTDAARVMTAVAVDLGERPSVISAIIKYHATERMRQVINDAMDVLGGRGICMGPRNFLARFYQAVPISITVEGANILTRNLIIFGQGAIRGHPWILREMQAIAEHDPDRRSRLFDRAFCGHVRFFLGHLAGAIWLGLTRARLVSAPVSGPEAAYYRQLTRLSTAFALAADVSLMVLGGSLKRRERLSARLGDVLSHLYLASAVLKRFRDQGSPAEDLPLVHWACQHLLYQAQAALEQLVRNFPSRPVARLLRLAVFPMGRPYRDVSDFLSRRAARILLEPSPARDRLTGGIFVPRDPDDCVGRVEVALEKAIQAEPLEKRLRHAVRSRRIGGLGKDDLLRAAREQGLLTEQEVDLIRQADAARRDAIAVDEFEPDDWLRP